MFINTIGAGSNRPRPKTRIKNLHLAGDCVKKAIDLACLEGAVSSGMEAATLILNDHDETEALPVVQIPPEWPRAMLVLARILMIPLVAVARASTGHFECPYPSNAKTAEGFAPAVEAGKLLRIHSFSSPANLITNVVWELRSLYVF